MSRWFVGIFIVVLILEVSLIGYFAALGYRSSRDIDADGDGSVSFEEFIAALGIKKRADPERPDCARYLGLVDDHVVRVVCITAPKTK